jgi:hypothetical protein
MGLKRRHCSSNKDERAASAEWHRSLPVFTSMDALRQSRPWEKYLDQIYGLATLRFPLDIRLLALFYEGLLAPAIALPNQTRVPVLGRSETATRDNSSHAVLEEVLLPARATSRRYHVCGRRFLDAYRLYHSPPFPEGAASSTLWLYAYKSLSLPRGTVAAAAPAPPSRASLAFPRDGFSSHTRVEVFHCIESAEVKNHDYWMYYAPGSGVYYDLGRTLVARSRCDLWRFANASFSVDARGHGGPRCVRYNNAWREGTDASTFGGLLTEKCPGFWCGGAAEKAKQSHVFTTNALDILADRGLDSVQLTHTEEHGIYKYEIVDLRQHVRESLLPPSRPVQVERPVEGGTPRGRSANSRFIETEPERIRAFAPRVCPLDSSTVSAHFYGGWGGGIRCQCSGVGPVRGCFACQRASS